MRIIMNKLEFFEKLLVYKQDAIKTKELDKEVNWFYDGIIVGLTEAYSIIFPDDITFSKGRIRHKDKVAINYIKARIAELKK
jgi:hypothetical protein